MSFKDEFTAIAGLNAHSHALPPENIPHTAPRFIARSMSALEMQDQSSLVRHFDFLTRVMCIKSGDGLQAIPFSNLDREMLEAMRGKLIELGGNPPELPGAVYPPIDKPRREGPPV